MHTTVVGLQIACSAVVKRVFHLQNHVHPRVAVLRSLVRTLRTHHVSCLGKLPGPTQGRPHKLISVRCGLVVAHKLLIQRRIRLASADPCGEPCKRPQTLALLRMSPTCVDVQGLAPLRRGRIHKLLQLGLIKVNASVFRDVRCSCVPCQWTVAGLHAWIIRIRIILIQEAPHSRTADPHASVHRLHGPFHSPVSVRNRRRCTHVHVPTHQCCCTGTA
mmetsp:Transcript_28443/g.48304  ORF Transcript_28443/g.48304 Transcript_28443/m.48304 type:complete len:218 (-) Transcript_28443:79-732(-)